MGRRINEMKKRGKLMLIIAMLVVIIAALIAIIMIILSQFLPGFLTGKGGNTVVITSAQLERAINVSELSTAEFIYNGVAEKYKYGSKTDVECYIAYDATVKAGIQMEDVRFIIDDTERTVMPILPEIKINIASLDEEAISYIPKNPDVDLKDIITVCKEDAVNEADDSELLYEVAEYNLRSAIEALLSPVVDDAGYSIVWE